MAKTSKERRAAPWDRANPKGGTHHERLGSKAKASAKARAHRAGRPYPNLVDNMAVARQTKDSEGGLTAAGRAEFRRKQGSHLKPGVRKPASAMTPEDMRRKGSWAARFFGRETLPPLRKKSGEPTRFALSAHAWGEKVPATVAEARKIARKGRALLTRYERERGSRGRSRARA